MSLELSDMTSIVIGLSPMERGILPSETGAPFKLMEGEPELASVVVALTTVSTTE